MLTGEEPEVWNGVVIDDNRTHQSKNTKPSDVIIDIEPTTTMVEQTKTNNRRSRLTAAEEATKNYFQRSVSISIAVLQRRHVRFRFQQDTTSSETDGIETVPLIPEGYNRTVRMPRSNTTADIVTDLGELAALLTNVECITRTDGSKRTEKIVFTNNKRSVVSNTFQDTIAPSTSRTKINVVGKGRIDVGPVFVDVKQKVIKSDIISGTFLGFKLQSHTPKRNREVRCGVVVFVFFVILISCGMLQHVIRHGFGDTPKPIERIKLDIPKWWYIDRNNWKAEKESNMTDLTTPILRVIVAHSENADFCIEKDECIKYVQEMQKLHKDYRGWVDIGPNFLISGNGLVFEGRGANIQGSTIENKSDLTIMFLGHYVRDLTSPEQFQHLEYLLDELVYLGILSSSYELLGHCQIAPIMISPGPNVMDELRKMKNFKGSLSDDIHCARH